ASYEGSEQHAALYRHDPGWLAFGPAKGRDRGRTGSDTYVRDGRACDFRAFDLSGLSAKAALCRCGPHAGGVDCERDPCRPYAGREIRARSSPLENVPGLARRIRSLALGGTAG